MVVPGRTPHVAAEPSRRRHVSDFLRYCRGRVSPVEVGLPETRRRRTPGLRREDVAALAGVSVTWYTWLEQGREIQVSDDVLERIAATLRLSGDEREYLFALVKQRAAPPAATPLADAGDDTLARTIEAFGVPALVMTARWDIVAWNGLAAAIFGRRAARAAAAPPNFLRMLLVDGSRNDRTGFEAMARRVLARFRIDYGRAAGDAEYEALVAELAVSCPGFAALWREPHVAASAGGVVQHPELGGLLLEHSEYVPAGHPTLRLVVLVPQDAPTEEKIAALRRGLARSAEPYPLPRVQNESRSQSR